MTIFTAAANTYYNTANANALQASESWINVHDFGAFGDNSANDTTAINAAINASKPGDVIFFPAFNFWRNNQAVYLCTGDIHLKPHRAYIGGGGSLSSAPTIGLYGTGNPDAILASDGWYGSSSPGTADEPIYVFNLQIDGGATSGGVGAKYGLVLMNFWSTVEQVQVRNVLRDGFVVPGQLQNTTYKPAAQSPENKFIRCRTEATGDNGFRVWDTAGGIMTDVIFENCVASKTGARAPKKYASGNYHGFYLEDSAGAFIRGCHTYTCDGDGFHLLKGWASSLTDNYVDGIGPDTGSTGSYHGIYVELKADTTGMRGVIINGNKIGDSATPAYSTTGIRVIMYTGGKGYTTVSGNVVNVHGTGGSGNGLSYESTSNGTLYAASSGNIVGGSYSYPYTPHTYAAVGATVTVFAGC